MEVGGEDVEVLVSTPSSTADILCTCILLLPFVLTDVGPAVKPCAMWLQDMATRASERPNDEVDTLIFSVYVLKNRDMEAMVAPLDRWMSCSVIHGSKVAKEVRLEIGTTCVTSVDSSFQKSRKDEYPLEEDTD